MRLPLVAVEVEVEVSADVEAGFRGGCQGLTVTSKPKRMKRILFSLSFSFFRTSVTTKNEPRKYRAGKHSQCYVRYALCNTKARQCRLN